MAHRNECADGLPSMPMRQGCSTTISCVVLLLMAGMTAAAAQSPAVKVPAQARVFWGASAVLAEGFLGSNGLELPGGRNSAASSPDFFVDAWQSFQSKAAPREPGDASFDTVLAAVEAAQVQLVNGQPDPFKALWAHGEDVTLGSCVCRAARDDQVQEPDGRSCGGP